TELCVNPPQAIEQIATWLKQSFDVRGEFATNVSSVSPLESGDSVTVETSCGRSESFDRVIVCGGTESQSLFPELLAKGDLKLCKLQMLKTAPQPAGWRLGPNLASGLTLRHYRNFEVCPSLPALRRRIATESPLLDRYGIHVMAAQNDAGEVI